MAYRQYDVTQPASVYITGYKHKIESWKMVPHTHTHTRGTDIFPYQI